MFGGTGIPPVIKLTGETPVAPFRLLMNITSSRGADTLIAKKQAKKYGAGRIISRGPGSFGRPKSDCRKPGAMIADPDVIRLSDRGLSSDYRGCVKDYVIFSTIFLSNLVKIFAVVSTRGTTFS
jgi:hypothetical protein